MARSTRRRNLVAARRFFGGAGDDHGEPDEVITDLAPALETVIEDLIPNSPDDPTMRQSRPLIVDTLAPKGVNDRAERANRLKLLI